MGTVQDILIRKRPNRATVWIATDSDAAEKFQAAELELSAARSMVTVRADDAATALRFDQAKEAYEAAKAYMTEHALKFVFEAVGRRRYEELLGEYPSTEVQKRTARDAREEIPIFDPDHFPQAVCAESLVDPKLTLDEVQELWDSDSFNSAEIFALYAGCMEVNQSRKVVDLGKD